MTLSWWPCHKMSISYIYILHFTFTSTNLADVGRNIIQPSFGKYNWGLESVSCYLVLHCIILRGSKGNRNPPPTKNQIECTQDHHLDWAWLRAALYSVPCTHFLFGIHWYPSQLNILSSPSEQMWKMKIYTHAAIYVFEFGSWPEDKMEP